MPFTLEECQSVGAQPESAFGGANAEKRDLWILTVTQTDKDAESNHPIILYAGVARILAETIGSVEMSDNADEYIREQILSLIKAGVQLFSEDSQLSWKNFKILPAHITCALRVQKKAVQAAAAPLPVIQTDLESVITKYVKSQQETLEKEKKKGTLSLDLNQQKIVLTALFRKGFRPKMHF